MDKKNKNPLPDTLNGAVKQEKKELKVREKDGIKWRIWSPYYRLMPGEKVSIHPQLGKVVTGGK